MKRYAGPKPGLYAVVLVRYLSNKSRPVVNLSYRAATLTSGLRVAEGSVRVGGDYLNGIGESIAYTGVGAHDSSAASGSA